MMNYSELSDLELLNLVKNGNMDAEDVLISRYIYKVRIISRSFFLAGADNEDLMQEGLIGLLSAIRNFDLNRNVSFATYAGSCIKNRIIDLIRKTDTIPVSLSELEESEADDSYNPENLVIDEENFREKLESYKIKLSPFEFKVIKMYLHGLSSSEMAMALNKKTSSIYNAMERIRSKVGKI
jgi:RNA polymerase sigma factor, sigma-70 family